MNNIKLILQELFPGTQDSVLEEASHILEIYASSFGVNTSLRLCHFLAQVREEVGAEFRPTRENLNYSEKGALSLFKNMTPELAEKYARDEDTPKADQVAIANIVYANKLGNGKADTDNDGQLDADDDGWKFRGAGCLQITGKANFEEVQKRISKYAPASGIDIIRDPDCVSTLKGSILTGLGFWMWKDLYKIADLGSDDKVVDKVTSIINKYTDSYDKRKLHFRKIKKFLSK